MLANEHGLINLSINPIYRCNFRCPTCYLTEEQLSDKKLLRLEDLERRLREIVDSGHHIGHADIYGGEVTLLPPEYMMGMKYVLHQFGIDEIELITNLSTMNNPVVHDEDFGLSVSFDFKHREASEHVFKNLLKLERPFTVLTLGIPDLLKEDPAAMIEELNLLQNCKWWEIKPYSSNQANQLNVPYRDFERFIQAVVEYPNKQFEFLNEGMLSEAIRMGRNSFSDDHVYITPTGRFGVLEFDLNDHEFFLEMDRFDQYLEWTFKEKARVLSNKFCSSCEYSGKCLSEHLRDVKSLDESCNGFFHLIKWYENHDLLNRALSDGS